MIDINCSYPVLTISHKISVFCLMKLNISLLIPRKWVVFLKKSELFIFNDQNFINFSEYMLIQRLKHRGKFQQD